MKVNPATATIADAGVYSSAGQHRFFGDLAVIVFLLTQVSDGVLTYIGVATYGLAVEGNPLIAWLMHALGEGPGLATAKVTAGGFGAANRTINKHGALGGGQAIGRGRATAGVDVSYPLIRRFGATDVIVEPMAQLSLSSDPDLDPRIHAWRKDIADVQLAGEVGRDEARCVGRREAAVIDAVREHEHVGGEPVPADVRDLPRVLGCLMRHGIGQRATALGAARVVLAVRTHEEQRFVVRRQAGPFPRGEAAHTISTTTPRHHHPGTVHARTGPQPHLTPMWMRNQPCRR